MVAMKLDYSLLYELYCSCYENGVDLLEEASILFENERYTRAYTLAHLSLEELAKLPMINTYMGGVVHGKEFDVNHLLKRLRDHQEKIQMSYFIGELVGEPEVDIFNKQETVEFVKTSNNMKNNSIYVGLKNRIINKPTDFVNKDNAIEMIGLAAKHVQFHSTFAELSEEEFKEIHSDELFQVLSKYKG